MVLRWGENYMKMALCPLSSVGSIPTETVENNPEHLVANKHKVGSIMFSV